MNKRLKMSLLGLAAMVASPTILMANNEFSFDVANDDSFTELVNSGVVLGMYQTLANNNVEDFLNVDISVNSNGTLVANEDVIVGSTHVNAVSEAIKSTASDIVLTIVNDEKSDMPTVMIVDGGIVNGIDSISSLTDYGMSVIFKGDIQNKNTITDSFMVDVKGAIDLGAGTVSIINNNANSNNTVTVKVNGDYKTSSTTLQDNDSAAILVFDGEEKQIIESAFVGNVDNSGTLVFNNTHEDGVVFTGSIGKTDKNIAAIKIGTEDGKDSTATFIDNSLVGFNVSTWTLGNGGTTEDTISLSIDANGDIRTHQGTIDGSEMDIETLNIIDSSAGLNTNTNTNVKAKKQTFAGVIGGNTKIDHLTIGNEDYAGSALFEEAVSAINISLTSANIVNVEQLTEAVFQGDVTATAIVLDENRGEVVAVFDISIDKKSNIITGTIDGGDSNEGTVVVIDSTDSIKHVNTITFSNDIGATNNLHILAIGDTGDGGHGIFNGTVAADAIDVNSTGTKTSTTANFNETVTANTIDVSSRGAKTSTTANFNNVVAIETIDIISNGTDESVVTANFNGTVIAETIIVDSTGVEASATANFINDVTATNLYLKSGTNDATVIFNGTTAQTIDVSIDSFDTGNKGDVVISGSNVIFNKSIGEENIINSFIVELDKKAQFAGTVLNATNITNDGDMEFAGTILNATNIINNGNMKFASTTLNATNITNNSDMELNTFTEVIGTVFELNGSKKDSGATITLGASFSSDDVIIDATNVKYLNATNVVKIIPYQSFIDGSITLIDGPGTGNYLAMSSDELTQFTTESGVLASYDFSVSDDKNIVITATIKSASTIGSELSITDAQANTLINSVSVFSEHKETDHELMTAFNTALGTKAEAVKMAAQLTQEVGAISASNAATMSASSGAINGRQMANIQTASRYDNMNKVASSSYETGISSGSSAFDSDVWVEVFGSDIKMEEHDLVAGYNADVMGVAVGFDTLVDKNTHLGMAVSFSDVEVESEGVGKNNIESDSFQISLYGTQFMDDFFINGMVGVAFNDNDTSRILDAGGLTERTITGSYDSIGYNIKVGTGVPMKLGNSNVIPTFGMEWSMVDSDSYTENGGLNANQKVDISDQHVFELVTGVATNWEFGMDGFTLMPEIRVGVSADIANDESEAVVNYTNSNTTFITTGADVSVLGGTIGGGFSLNSDDGSVGISINYDAKIKEDFISHNGMLKARYNF